MSEEKVPAICDHCGAKYIIYRHSFNKGLARVLELLYKYRREPMVRLSNLGLSLSQRCTATQLQEWGLAAPVITEETEAKRGWWKITQLGIDFVQAKTKIHKIALIRRREVLGFEGNLITMQDADPNIPIYRDFADQARDQIRGQGSLFRGG